ncbi:hypothetical protein [Phaeobacter sp. HF9A]|uniref:hypothetical protein n=1 Tax=Phaeobacter sp. HF9A TaxID=2721561 RepID=UPI00142F6895|nr:hypothetical protein [Phaeobacter sp. HF9A]NIZ11864.1 hypothetical protein [Phaeobacter sp. HF9A]
MGTRVTALTVAATVVCALGTGLYMQKRAEQRATAAPLNVAALPDIPTDPISGDLLIQDMSFTSAPPPVDAPTETAQSSVACHGDMTVRAEPGAMLAVEIEAPCHAGERFTLHHGGLMVTEALDHDGHFTGSLPAFTPHAVVIADFVTGQDLDAAVEVEDLQSVDRIALQWQGNSGLEVHALEFGATYGDAGHVWSQSAPGQGTGQVDLIGAPEQSAPNLVEVYSLPRRDVTERRGEVSVSIEAEVTATNCDRAIEAELVEWRGGRLRSRDLVLNMPDCSAVGDFLVLNNIVETLKIASN